MSELPLDRRGRALLDPFAQRYARLVLDMERAFAFLSESELAAVERAASQFSQTNCGWQEYGARAYTGVRRRGSHRQTQAARAQACRERCGGTEPARPRVKPDPLVSEEVVAFLAQRLIGKAGDRGLSSDAMIAAAVAGLAPSEDFYPRDSGDLGRCFEAFNHAPHELRTRLYPLLRSYIDYVEARSLGVVPSNQRGHA